MKAFFQLILLSVLLYFGYNYVKENKTEVKSKVYTVVRELEKAAGELKDELQEELDHINIPENNPKEHDLPQANGPVYQSTESLHHHSHPRAEANGNPPGKKPPRVQPAQSKDTYNKANEKARSGWIMEATRKHSPDSWVLLQDYEGLPHKVSAKSGKDYVMNSQKTVDTYHYVHYDSKLSCLKSMSTNVHEIGHASYSLKPYMYANQQDRSLEWENVRGYIYLSPGEGYLVSFPKKMLFPSRELAGRIPYSLRSFRFDTYINGNTSTQNEGIFGLLDEFHAYYLGSRFSYDMYEVYNKLYSQPGKGLFQWITSITSNMAAFYEFHFFMQEYLLYMKEAYPGKFEQLMRYTPFRKAYRAVYHHYHQLVGDYKQLIVSEMERLNKQGEAKAYIKDGEFWIQPAGSLRRRGVRIFNADVEKLEPVLESSRYKPLQSVLNQKFHSSAR